LAIELKDFGARIFAVTTRSEYTWGYAQDYQAHSFTSQGAYHIRNWSAYDRALAQRGSLTVWVSDDALQA